MSNYVYGAQQQTFGTRDSLPPGSTEKIVQGIQMDREFNRLSVVSAEKLDKTGTDFSGTIQNGIIDGGTY